MPMIAKWMKIVGVSLLLGILVSGIPLVWSIVFPSYDVECHSSPSQVRLFPGLFMAYWDSFVFPRS